MNTEIRELDVAELDQVSGGHFLSFFVRFVPVVAPPREPVEPVNPQGGGQSDPAQMFQQIMQQLTQGAA